MDSGCFYSRNDSLLRPPGMGSGFQTIPRQMYTAEDVAALNGDYPEVHVGLGQKLDQMVYMMREQARETAIIKEELTSLRTDVKELQDTNALLSESLSSTPASRSGSSTPSSTKRIKIPTQLSVREPSNVCLCRHVYFL